MRRIFVFFIFSVFSCNAQEFSSSMDRISEISAEYKYHEQYFSPIEIEIGILDEVISVTVEDRIVYVNDINGNEITLPQTIAEFIPLDAYRSLLVSHGRKSIYEDRDRLQSIFLIDGEKGQIIHLYDFYMGRDYDSWCLIEGKYIVGLDIEMTKEELMYIPGLREERVEMNIYVASIYSPFDTRLLYSKDLREVESWVAGFERLDIVPYEDEGYIHFRYWDEEYAVYEGDHFNIYYEDDFGIDHIAPE